MPRLLVILILLLAPIHASAQPAPRPANDNTAGPAGAAAAAARARDVHIDDHCGPTEAASDAAACLQAGLAALAAAGGGTMRLGPKVYPVIASDITIPPSVELYGNAAAAGERTAGNYGAAGPALALGPSRTVRFSAGGSALRGVNVLRHGMRPPTNAREALNGIRAFAGTAITVQGASDALIEDVLIIGFDACIGVANSERPRFNRVFGDCRQGLLADHVHDVGRFSSIHWWPYYSTHHDWTFTSFPVANARNNGAGAIRLTLAAPMSGPNAVATGDLVQVTGIVGVPNANSRFAVRVLDGRTIDLEGSSFSGAYASGGAVHLNTTIRTGDGFRFTNAESLICRDCFSYGYDTGFRVGDGAIWVELVNSSADGFYDPRDPTTACLVLEGTSSQTHMFGGFLSSCGVSVRYNSASLQPSLLDGVAIGAGGPGMAVEMLRGKLTVSNSALTGGSPIFVATGAAKFTMIGTDRGGSPFRFQSENFGAVTEVGPTSIMLNGCQILADAPVPTMPAPDCSIYLRSGDGGGLYVHQRGAWVPR